MKILLRYKRLCLAISASTLHGIAVAREIAEPTPMADPVSWVTMTDYPRSELAHGVTGVSAFALSIDRHGKVVDCYITGSSGAPGLDDATCRLMQNRARFIPAQDADGRTTESVWDSRVVWRIEQGATPAYVPPKQEIGVLLDVDEKGFIERCEVITFTTDPEVRNPSPCAQFPVGKKMLEYRNAGQSGRLRMIFRQSMEFFAR
jgi:periplasmic protein TonB